MRRPRFARLVLVVVWAGLLPACAPSAPAPASSNETFSLIALPDTQVYCMKFPEVFYEQTQWVKDNAARLNLKFVIHEGDMVEKGVRQNEWLVADRAMRTLDGSVPYGITVGNHDFPTSLYNKHFPPSRFAGQAWYGGHMGQTNENSYQYFQGAGMDFLVVCLRFNPTPEMLAWANRVVERHPRHRVIVATHSYIDRVELTPEGEKVWEGFVRRHRNLFLVLCGHLSVGRRDQVGDHGNRVYALLADYQGLDFGGAGWLRILTFVPEKNIIQVRTYSTMKKKFLGPGDDKYSTPPMNDFDLPYPMAAPAPAPLPPQR